MSSFLRGDFCSHPSPDQLERGFSFFDSLNREAEDIAPLKVLVLEDEPNDLTLLLEAIRRAGFVANWQCVDNEEDYLKCLEPDLDIVLSDYTMPRFDAARALFLLQETGYDVPFIIVTGSISEEVAVESMKQGAADYLLKDRLSRLGQVIVRALDQRRAREEKRKTEEALRRSEERYRLLVANIPDVSWMADASGMSLFVSPNSEQIYGYTADEMCRMASAGCTRFDLTHEEDAARVRQRYSALFSSNEPFDVEYRIRRKDGQWIWVRERAVVTYEQNGVRSAYGVTSDITHAKQLQAQLVQAQKMEAIGKLAGGVAHDFNNLLTAIIGYSQLLLSELDENDPKRDRVDQIEKAGVSAASLTRQLLAFSKQQMVEPRVLDINAVVCGTEKILRRVIGEDITLVTKLRPGIGFVKADPGQIEQVVMNLAVNARDAMPNGGALMIETGDADRIEGQGADGLKPGPYTTVEVTDTGVGMDSDTISRIFEPFFTTKETGTGLGLATVYNVVNQCGGHVSVRSELHVGTSFRVYLPVSEEINEPVQPEPIPSTHHGSGQTILLVEDDNAVRSLALNILKMSGYRILEAASGDEALQLSEGFQEGIDLMITDTVMPGMGGLDLADRVGRSRPGMKIMLMSGYSDRLLDLGSIDARLAFLAKPFTPLALAKKVEELLDDTNLDEDLETSQAANASCE